MIIIRPEALEVLVSRGMHKRLRKYVQGSSPPSIAEVLKESCNAL